MKDPYLYEDVPVLKNYYGIKSQSVLDMVETDKVYSKLLASDRLLKVDTVTDFEYLKKIHFYLFGEIYPFAGENRKIVMEKSEPVLTGKSVSYSAPDMIESAGKTTVQKMNGYKWNTMTLDEQTKEFSRMIAALWQIHPFREGNTRTTILFACHYALQHGFSIDREILFDNPRYTRDSLVVSSIGTYSKPEYLEKIMRKSLIKGDTNYFKKKAIEIGIRPKERAIKSLQEINKHYGRNVSADEIKQKWRNRKQLSEPEIALLKPIGKELEHNQSIRTGTLER